MRNNRLRPMRQSRYPWANRSLRFNLTFRTLIQRWVSNRARKVVWCLSFVIAICLVSGFSRTTLAQNQKVILVVGAAGSNEYEKQFDQWAENWKTTIQSEAESNTNIELVTIGPGSASGQSDLQRFQSEIESTGKDCDELWIVLIGHGTDDRKSSKFNLRGRDVSASELNQWLVPITCRVVLINCASASGAFISKLKGANRIVVTATKSGAQHNFARFGGYFSEAISDPALDLDKDQQTSLLEAFIGASARTQEFYVLDTRLATELAMIDDNSDGLATPADWFQGTRVVRKSKDGQPDGLASNQLFLVRRSAEALLSKAQRVIRDTLEAKLESLRSKKDAMNEDAYYRAIEPVLLDLARVYESVSSAK